MLIVSELKIRVCELVDQMKSAEFGVLFFSLGLTHTLSSKNIGL